MLRGEFIFASGLVVPNNITKFGAESILRGAMRGEALTFWVGLVDAAPDADLLIENVTEPTIGTNGYARQQLTQDATGWPTVGETNAEPYVETDWLTWTATGGDFDQATSRMMIVTSETDLTGDVFALSAAAPTLAAVTPTTPEADRKFKYRVYLR